MGFAFYLPNCRFFNLPDPAFGDVPFIANCHMSAFGQSAQKYHPLSTIQIRKFLNIPREIFQCLVRPHFWPIILHAPFD